MKSFEILEHKADLKIKASGKTKEELFLNMLLAVASVLGSQQREEHNEVLREISIKSLNTEMLLVDFLNEILYLSQVNKEVYTNIKFKKFTENELEGELKGKRIERFKEDIKAATYHNLQIKQTKQGLWEAVVLFDV